VTADDPGIVALRNAAEQHKVPLAVLQANIDAIAKIEADSKANWQTQLGAWQNELKSDQEFGGAKLEQNMAHAKKLLDTYGDPELQRLLDESGFAKHPSMLKFLMKLGKETAEAPVIKSSGEAAVDVYRLMYPNSPQMFPQ
jgi:hypothetical protein